MENEVNNKGIIRLVEEEKSIVKWLIKQPETIQIQEVFERVKEKLNEHNKDFFNQYTWDHWWGDCVETLFGTGLYYSTSEAENALDYLDTASEALVSNSQHRWKRIILGLHGAVYGLAISVLGSSNYKYVVKKNNNGEEKLIVFKEAIKQVIKTKGHLNVPTPDPIFSKEEKEALNQLNDDYRNNFQHFIPGRWSIQMSGLPLICMRTLTPIIILACNLFGLKNYVEYMRLVNCVHQIAHLLLLEHAKLFIAERKAANGAD